MALWKGLLAVEVLLSAPLRAADARAPPRPHFDEMTMALRSFDQHGCEDRAQDCEQLQEELFDLQGRCRYPAAELCMKTCGLCDRVRSAKRCEVSSCYPFCVPSIDWVAFLQSAVQRAISLAMSPAARLLRAEAPVIAEFPQFLSAAEVTELISVAVQSGFQPEDPEDIPPEQRDVNKVDCENRQCLRHPLIQELYRRISELLGIPPQNFESIEFLLYNPGQHYEPHMDDAVNSDEPLTLSAGPRVLTVFFYLSEVERGGQTRFPELDLEVEPMTGKAVVWANVQQDIWRMDEGSLHQAVPVEEGTKIAANFWVHPFEYRSAERFCRDDADDG